MSDCVIRAESLGKKYVIGHQAEDGRYVALRDVLMQNARGLWHKTLDLFHGKPIIQGDTLEEVWALKDVSFEIRRGEAVGIIGRNGAGKSTLLKILSRIVEPSAGRVTIKGRVASLLEVGTGFHPELTGRENIYLNGAILGMPRAEIKRKFDEIVAFAEVEKYLDTPVKRYSSGMYVRLAFAVAAHLDPEILLVDEVLAVGDAAFQKKCVGKMGEVAREGRTILFVSHNMAAVTSLCGRLMLLRGGEVAAAGDPRSVIGQYVDTATTVGGERIWARRDTAPGNQRIRLRAVRVLQNGRATSEVCVDEDVMIEIEFVNLVAGARVSSSIHLLDGTGVEVLAAANLPSACDGIDEWFGREHPVGVFRSRCRIPANFLNTITYNVNAIVITDLSNVEAFGREVVSFTVHETGAMRKEYTGGWLGVVRPRLRWQTEHVGMVPQEELS